MARPEQIGCAPATSKGKEFKNSRGRGWVETRKDNVHTGVRSKDQNCGVLKGCEELWRKKGGGGVTPGGGKIH